MARVVLSVPMRAGRRIMMVRAVLEDGVVTTSNPEVAAKLESLKPDDTGYLPTHEYEWGKAAEEFLSARIISVEHDAYADEPTPPGICFGGPLGAPRHIGRPGHAPRQKGK